MARSFYRNETEQRTAAKENLNQYLKATSVLPLMLLVGAVIVLVGMIVWATTVNLEMDISAVVYVEDGVINCYTSEDEIKSNGRPESGNMAYVNGVSCTITSFNEEAFRVTSEEDSYLMHLGKFKAGDWVYQFTMEGNLPDGIYCVNVVTGKTTAVQLLLQ